MVAVAVVAFCGAGSDEYKEELEEWKEKKEDFESEDESEEKK